MEIHSYQGSLDPLWNSTAMEAVDSYGNSQLPRLLRPALEFHNHGGRTQLWNPRAGTNGQWRRVHPPVPCGQANPVKLRYLRTFRTIPV
jgi:hypothetical protein